MQVIVVEVEQFFFIVTPGFLEFSSLLGLDDGNFAFLLLPSDDDSVDDIIFLLAAVVVVVGLVEEEDSSSDFFGVPLSKEFLD